MFNENLGDVEEKPIFTGSRGCFFSPGQELVKKLTDSKISPDEI